jgi:hypothetical protein
MIWIFLGIALVVLAIIKYKEGKNEDFEQREN